MTRTLDRDAALELARKALNQETLTIDDLASQLGDGFCVCAQLLIECPGLIWTTAVGTSAAVAARFSHLLTCVGVRSMFLSPADGLHGHAAVMSEQDLLVAMSRGGESKEVNQMAAIANERGVKTIAFVHSLDSTLARSCRHVLPIPSKQEYELNGYIATTSTVAFSAMCDALTMVVQSERGYTPEQFAQTHPGGAVGQILTAEKHRGPKE
jgi:D-arabinose 5-phosphate isomerase GutQ